MRSRDSSLRGATLKKHICIVLVALFSLKIASVGLLGVPVVIAPEPNDNARIAQETAKNKALRAWLDELKDMENCVTDGTMDSGSLSYGPYCFKKSTYLEAVKEFEFYPYAEENELWSHLSDKHTQEWIIEAWIEEDINQLADFRFRTSIVKRGLGLP